MSRQISRRTVLRGLGAAVALPALDAMAPLLTGCQARKTDGKDIRAGVSVDQLAAEKIGGRTKLASIELGTEKGAMAGNCDSGYSCAYSSAIAWKTPTLPLPKEINPRAV